MTVADLYRRLDGLIERLRLPGSRDVHYIDYAFRDSAVFYHGSLSDLDGVIRSTWTYEEDGQVVTRDRPLDSTGFSRLWTGLNILPVFRRSLCNDMSRSVDPAAEHVVSHIYVEKGEVGRCVCLVPVSEGDKAFEVWLGLLQRPDGSA